MKDSRRSIGLQRQMRFMLRTHGDSSHKYIHNRKTFFITGRYDGHPKATENAGSAIFELEGARGHVWNCFLILIFYCCNIPEGKNVSGVKHGTAGTGHFVKCLVSLPTVLTCEGRRKQQLNSTKIMKDKNLRLLSAAERMNWRYVYGEKQDLARAAKKMEVLSLWRWESFLKRGGLEMQGMFLDTYRPFTFEPLHTLDLRISKLQNEMVSCIYHLKHFSPTGETRQGGGRP